MDKKLTPRELPPLELILAGYQSGFVPHARDGVLGWQIPIPRYFIDLKFARFPANVWQRTRKNNWKVTVGRDFDNVVSGCASSERSDSARWMVPELISLYQQLHRAELATSFEVWDGGELVAGEFGLVLGGTFFAESKFHLASHAGNLCTGAAILTLAAHGYRIYDAQYGPDYLNRFSSEGLRTARPKEFVELVRSASQARFSDFLGESLAPMHTAVLPDD